ncbi:MAG TPA: oligogalacturonate lyase family protein [Tepidisphaeraceae bacterium]|nr:oligogalacturonate lyase family protein [Tepidisphaeraceae bacterium]
MRRLTDEPNSVGFYFNINAYTPDGREMVYSTPDSIRVLNLETMQTRPVVSGANLKTVVVGRKTPSIFFIKQDERELCVADINTGAVRTLAKVPARGLIASVNAAETLAAGTYIEGSAGEDYGEKRVMPPGMSGPLVQPLNKARMMEERLAAHLPLVLFTIDLKTGQMRELLHSTDWINHLLFSPVDPSLLMYCHEGPWHKVDRIWTIRTDGSQNQLIHKRTMNMEIAGHEFWGQAGETIWYDLQTPKGEDFWLAAYDLPTSRRRWFHLQRNEWSIHFNVTSDESLFCGDGGDTGQVARAPDGKWIELFRPQSLDGQDPAPDLIHPGVFHSEHLVNMSKHNYRLEPNVRFSPDDKMVLFSSNMFGPSYVFGVDVQKAEQAGK